MVNFMPKLFGKQPTHNNQQMNINLIEKRLKQYYDILKDYERTLEEIQSKCNGKDDIEKIYETIRHPSDLSLEGKKIGSYSQLIKSYNLLKKIIKESKEKKQKLEEQIISNKYEEIKSQPDYQQYNDNPSQIEYDCLVNDYKTYQMKHPNISPLQFLEMALKKYNGRLSIITGIEEKDILAFLIELKEYGYSFSKMYNYLYQINKELASKYLKECMHEFKEAKSNIILKSIPNHVSKYDLSIYSSETDNTNSYIRSDKECRTAYNVFLETAKDEDTRNVLEEILFAGKVEDLDFYSGLSNHQSPSIEVNRRIGMANLLFQNRDAFKFVCSHKINLFHGTKCSALPSIIENGLHSIASAKKESIDITTGEDNMKRGFVSFTDSLEVATEYAKKSKSKPGLLDFPIIICIPKEIGKELKSTMIESECVEVSIIEKVGIDAISCILVPPGKEKIVEDIIEDNNINIFPVDFDNKFYYIGPYYNSSILIYPELIEDYKTNNQTESQSTSSNKGTIIK